MPFAVIEVRVRDRLPVSSRVSVTVESAWRPLSKLLNGATMGKIPALGEPSGARDDLAGEQARAGCGLAPVVQIDLLTLPGGGFDEGEDEGDAIRVEYRHQAPTLTS